MNDYNLEEVLEFCKTINRYELKAKYRKCYNFLLNKHDLNKIQFLPKKKPKPKYEDNYIIDITKNLKFRTELLTLYPDVYKYIKNKGYFKTICKHLIPISISKPQLILKFITDKLLLCDGELNNRKILKPYEIDVYYDKFKIGFEYNGAFWHSNNINDQLKLNLACKKNIIIITINENNKDCIIDIKNELINNINILFKFNNLITVDYINSILVDYNYIINYDLNKYKETALKYKTKTDFCKNDYIIYNNCVKLNILEIVGEHFEKYIYWNEEIALNKASEYNNADELQNNYPGCYQYLLKNNLLYKIKYKTKRFLYKNVDEQYLINNFTSIQNLMKDYNSLYKYIKNNIPDILNVLKYYDISYIEQLLNTIDTLNNFRDKYRLVFKISYTDFEYKTYINNYFKYKDYNKYFLLDFNLNEIKSICLKYDGVIKFKKDYNKIYKYLCKNKLIDECFQHLDTLKFRNNKL